MSHAKQDEAIQLKRLASAIVLVAGMVIAIALCASLGEVQAAFRSDGDGVLADKGLEELAGTNGSSGAVGSNGIVGATDTASTSSGTSTSYAHAIWEAIGKGVAFDEAMVQQGFRALSAQAQIPSWLTEEVVDASSIREGYASGDYGVIGCVIDGNRVIAQEALLRLLAEKGWVPCTASNEGTITLMKQEGECRWLMVESVELEDETSVVLHIARS